MIDPVARVYERHHLVEVRPGRGAPGGDIRMLDLIDGLGRSDTL